MSHHAKWEYLQAICSIGLASKAARARPAADRTGSAQSRSGQEGLLVDRDLF